MLNVAWSRVQPRGVKSASPISLCVLLRPVARTPESRTLTKSVSGSAPSSSMSDVREARSRSMTPAWPSS
eukprot:2798157-Prymnesium_polylepis.1